MGPVSMLTVGVVWRSLGTKIPTIIVDWGNLGLEVDAILALHNVVVAQALIPWSILENALAVHVDPSFLKAEDATRREINTTVVEVVADGDEGAAVLHGAWEDICISPSP